MDKQLMAIIAAIRAAQKDMTNDTARAMLNQAIVIVTQTSHKLAWDERVAAGQVRSIREGPLDDPV